ncbi:DNA-directed RNA polymerase subunit alpha C-terminal domain-containing protein [Streptomyces sp. NPDC088194]|uniref:DNA-directed RNA polymerase subunit alpha C-terminal domain-containing protein n=1 Tax=Streptomyces sp. NPDC088194 TaxID=3154931 RepID=UPI00344DE9E9
MAGDLFFRTEDIRQEEVVSYLVETPTDRSLINALKGRSPVVLKGSRGVGKSFLMRVAEAELKDSFSNTRILPVYITFAKAGLIRANTPDKFMIWMMSKICNAIVRASSSYGLSLPDGSAIAVIQGAVSTGGSQMEKLELALEESWKNHADSTESAQVPDTDTLRDAIEDLCRYADLQRICLFIDEAAHVFIPEQQRQFFTLMRDLRSPFVAVKAAVYPGATAYGDSFQPMHDASTLSVDRLITESDYAMNMRQVVYKQDSTLRTSIERNGEVFDALAYAATGNPRTLLKTMDRPTQFNRRNISEVIKEYYREEIWAEHSALSERYPGHSDLIDWGRSFIEGSVIPALYDRNRHSKSETTALLWIHRDAPQAVREALRLLSYSGILQEGVSGIRGTRSQIGTRYLVNLGCLFALDADPISFGGKVRSALSIKRWVEYGPNHSEFRPLDKFSLGGLESEGNQALDAQLQRSIDRLDLSEFQLNSLKSLNFKTIGEVLGADEKDFMQAHYVGPKRSRKMRNSAIAAVLEYLSG